MRRRLGVLRSAVLLAVLMAVCTAGTAPATSAQATTAPATTAPATAARATTAPATAARATAAQAPTRRATATQATATRATAPGAGVPPTLAARLQQLVDDERTNLHAPGITAAVILPDGSTWTGQSGLADVAARLPVAADTRFAIGSITKTFVSATILQLVEEGRLALEDPLSRWYPDWPNGSHITVRMLLDHTGGIFDYFENPSYERLVFGRPTHRWTTPEILSLVRGPYFPPGAGYHYSNTDYVLLGGIIRQLTGHQPAAEIRQRFLAPLGLADEALQGEERIPFIAGRSYLTSGSGWADLSDGTRSRPDRSAATVASDAGAMLGSARDIAAWARALYGGSLLRPETLAEIETPSPYEPYGLGVRRFDVGAAPARTAWGHSGSLRGTVNIVIHLPFERLTVAVLINEGRVDPTPLTRRLAFASIWALQLPAEADQPPPLDSTKLAADYHVDASVDAAAGTLTAATVAHVTNTTDAPIGTLAFELAPLALGRATLTRLAVNGVPVTATTRDQTILMPIDPPLYPGAAADVAIDYGATFATGTAGSDWLLTRADGIFSAQRWIPWLAREVPFAHPAGAAPFVTGVAGSVDVAVTTDVPMKVAASGARIGHVGLRNAFHASGVRDVGLTASAAYRTRTRVIDGVSVRVAGTSSEETVALMAEAAWALPRLAAKLGPYPYATLSVARTAGGQAIDASGFVAVPLSGTVSSREVIVAGLAQQWSTAADPATDPFLDDGPAELAARSVLHSLRPSSCPSGRLDLAIQRYSDACYRERVAVDGANELESVRRAMGDATFWGAVRSYLAAHRDGSGDTGALLGALDAATPLSLADRFGLRFPRWYH